MDASVVSTRTDFVRPVGRAIVLVSLVLLLSSAPFVFGTSLNSEACDSLAHTLPGVREAAVPNAAVPRGVCASVFATGVGTPRGLLALPNGAGLLTVDTNGSRILFLRDYDGSGTIDQPNELVTLVTQPGLTHGLTLVNDNLLLASHASTVWSWPFNLAKPNTPITEQAAVFIHDVLGGHKTHTLALDATNSFLYIHSGSNSNVDATPDVSLIKRFSLKSVPSGGYAWSDGEVVARGLRNEVALAVDRYGVLWGAEMNPDGLERSDLGGDIHDDNPGEEINKFDAPLSSFYGYPYCWSEYNLPKYGQGPTTQWAWPDYMNDGTHTDDWCRNPANVVKPQYVMAAHSAPLGLLFTSAKDLADTDQNPFAVPFTTSDESYLYVAQHGSWDAQPPTGFRVQRFRVTDTGSSMTMQVATAAEDFFWYDSSNATGPDWRMRPVNLAIGPQGEIYLSNDVDGTHGSIVVLRYVDRTVDNSQPSFTSSGPGANSNPADEGGNPSNEGGNPGDQPQTPMTSSGAGNEADDGGNPGDEGGNPVDQPHTPMTSSGAGLAGDLNSTDPRQVPLVGASSNDAGASPTLSPFLLVASAAIWAALALL